MVLESSFYERFARGALWNNRRRRLIEIELQKKVGRSEEQVTILRDLFAGHLQRFYIQDAFDTYVFCLSEHDRANTDGLLSMCRGYGHHGNGAAFVFDAGAVTLVPTSPLIISKVSYASDRDRTTQLEERLEQWASLAQQARLPNEKLFLVAHARSRRRLETADLCRKHGINEASFLIKLISKNF